MASIFATGLGALTPAPPDGSVIGFPLPSLAFDVGALTAVPPPFPAPGTFSLASVNVLYAGPGPFEIEGLTQINIQVPPSPSLYLLVNSEPVITTLTGVTLWVIQ